MAATKVATKPKPKRPSVKEMGQWSDDLDKTWEQAQDWVTNKKVAPTPKESGPKMAEFQKQEKTTSFLNRRVGWNGSQLQAPQSMPTFASDSTGVHFNKATSSRLIILSMGIAGAAIIFGGRNFPSYSAPKPNGGTTKVPGTLHAFAGLTIAGTIALIVNEVSPDIGMALAVGLAFIALHDAAVFEKWGQAVFGKGTPSPPAKPPPTIPRSLPGNQSLPPSASFPGGGMYGNLSG